MWFAEEPECGDVGQSCCESFTCNSPDVTCRTNPVNADTVCVECGDRGQECCEGTDCNGERLACVGDPLIADEGKTCTACGSYEQPVCSSALLSCVSLTPICVHWHVDLSQLPAGSVPSAHYSCNKSVVVCTVGGAFTTTDCRSAAVHRLDCI